MHEGNCSSLCVETLAVPVAALIGFGIVIVTAVFNPLVRLAVRDNPALGTLKPFSFSNTWATNFTIAGAILASILSTNAGSASPAPVVSWRSLQWLSVLFGVVIAIAPFAYRGHVKSFLAATGVTLGAVIGQAGTATFITGALSIDALRRGDPFLVSSLVAVALLIGSVAVVKFVWEGIPATIQDYRAYTAALANAKTMGLAPPPGPPPVRLPT
jgi:hypothetical protein